MKLLCLLGSFAALTSSSAEGPTPKTWKPNHANPVWENVVAESRDMYGFCHPRNVEPKDGRPIPTNEWWGNLITCDNTNGFAPVWSNPYALSLDTVFDPNRHLNGLSFSYIYRHRYFGGSNDGAPSFYGHSYIREFTLTASEFIASRDLNLDIVSWSDAGVRVKLEASAGPSSSRLESNLVSGMAYVSAEYSSLKPYIQVLTPIMSFKGDEGTDGQYAVGKKFDIETADGSRWRLYASDKLKLRKQTEDEVPEPKNAMRGLVLVGDQQFSGTLRVASIDNDGQVKDYDKYKNCEVKGGTANVIDEDTYNYKWEISGDCSNGLLHFALPHHFDTLQESSAEVVSTITMNSAMRGMMKAYRTLNDEYTWELKESRAVPVTFYPYRRAHADPKIDLSYLFDQLVDDVQAHWNIPLTGSFYFTGKEVQKAAMLCLMANDRGIVGDDLSVLRRCVTKLESKIEPFITNSWTYKLTYDKLYGGMVSSQGFLTGDINADFGNTVYNDHHYHYGYWVYMAAVLNYLHPTWEHIDELNHMTELLIRDVATSTSTDKYFPKYRAFDWYRGHSYSHGQTTFLDGKDQESTSEDINFLYAMYLFGHATENKEMEAIGKLMTKLDAHAIQTYFLITDDNTVHPASFRSNKVTGIFFDNKADYATWFSHEPYCIHGIQMLPFSPVTELARSTEFIRQEWKTRLEKEEIVKRQELDNPWLSLLYTNYARIDRQAAEDVLWKVNLDSGLTRSWALYYAKFSQD